MTFRRGDRVRVKWPTVVPRFGDVPMVIPTSLVGRIVDFDPRGKLPMVRVDFDGALFGSVALPASDVEHVEPPGPEMAVAVDTTNLVLAERTG